MLRHLFKLIWNKKGKNTLLIIEIALSFFVFFAVLSFAIFKYNNFLKPLGFDYEDVWVINMEWAANSQSAAQLWEKKEQMKQYLHQQKEVEEFAFSGEALPFSQSSNSSTMRHGENKAHCNFFQASTNYAKTMNLNVVEGRWFSEEDMMGPDIPLVINQLQKEKLFPNQEVAVGQIVSFNGQESRIVGVVDHFRSKDEFQEPPRVTFIHIGDTSFIPSRILLKMDADADVVFEEKLMRQLSNMAPSWTFELEYMEEKKAVTKRLTTVPLIIMATVCGFLIFNVALGLFGVLWYNINQRKSEIGLRRASGASAQIISQQFIGETWVLATLGVVIGVFFAIQFPLMNVFDLHAGIYLLAILGSMFLIYLLTTICAYFPSKQAATIQPALALHEE